MRAGTDPRNVWLSTHFRLSDFLGNHSVYSAGLPNPFQGGQKELRNAMALCEYALEPMLEEFGPISISYGYICPQFSRRTVTYQDPDKPSHHRWDLGAAADVVVHNWVQEQHPTSVVPAGFARGSPAALAHELSTGLEIPYSRLITYSESPYLCIAVSAEEVQSGNVRRAFYENRFEGKSRAKPKYISQASESMRRKTAADLLRHGLPFDWRGQGYPSYHGGGREQYHHVRVSKYTMLSDWLFNLKSISSGVRNCVALADDSLQDSLAAAGTVYDFVIDRMSFRRMPILDGYLSQFHPDFSPGRSWAADSISFVVGTPDSSYSPETLTEELEQLLLPTGAATVEVHAFGTKVTVDVETALIATVLLESV